MLRKSCLQRCDWTSSQELWKRNSRVSSDQPNEHATQQSNLWDISDITVSTDLTVHDTSTVESHLLEHSYCKESLTATVAGADAVDVDLHFHSQGTDETSVCANEATDDRDRQYYEQQNMDNAQDDKHVRRSPFSVEFHPADHATTFSIDSQSDWHSSIFILLVLLFFFFIVLFSKQVVKKTNADIASNCSDESASSDNDKNSKINMQHRLNVKQKQLDTPRKIKLKCQISCLRKSVAHFRAKNNKKV